MRIVTLKDDKGSVTEVRAYDTFGGGSHSVESEMTRLVIENEKLKAALLRQCDNLAFVVNHVPLNDPLYNKLKSELEEDRVVLSKIEVNQT